MTTTESTAEFTNNSIGQDLNLSSGQSSVNNAIKATSLWERPALVSGILFVILQFGAMLYFITLVFPQMGPPDATVQKMVFYTEQGETLRWGNYLLMLPTPFFLFFLGGLSSFLRRSEGSGGLPITTTVIISGALVAILWPLSGVINNMGIDIAQAGGDAATVIALDAIGPYVLALSALPRAVLLAATSLILLHSQHIPRWIGWLGLGVGMISLIGSATLVLANLFPVLAFSTLLFELWILVLSVALMQRLQILRINS